MTANQVFSSALDSLTDAIDQARESADAGDCTVYDVVFVSFYEMFGTLRHLATSVEPKVDSEYIHTVRVSASTTYPQAAEIAMHVAQEIAE